MKAISIRQPWAWAIMHAGKDVENRNWRSKDAQGLVAVHAAWGMTQNEYVEFYEFYVDGLHQGTEPHPPAPAFGDFVRGAIIGTVEVVDCVEAYDSPWFTGKYGFVLKDPRPLPEPIFCQGARWFWDVPPSIASQIGL